MTIVEMRHVLKKEYKIFSVGLQQRNDMVYLNVNYDKTGSQKTNRLSIKLPNFKYREWNMLAITHDAK